MPFDEDPSDSRSELDMCIDEIKQLQKEKIAMRKAWQKYKDFLQDKYPAPIGEQWKFTCEHHKVIDKIMKGE